MQKPKPAKHLRPETRKWYAQICELFELESHHVRLLLLACECWDRVLQAREALAEHGLTYVDRFECPRPRPEVAIERDSRLAFARLLRELDLDAAAPPDVRPPHLTRNRRT
jgi:phage terminase small subunit